MSTTLLAAVTAATVLAIGAPTAHAHPAYDYAGGCSFTAANDTWPGGPLGGPDRWTGEVQVAVVATDAAAVPAPAAPVAVSCELFVNGVSRGVVLSATGIGVAAAVAPFAMTAREEDVVRLCDRVVVAGERHDRCPVPEDLPPVAQTVRDTVNWILDSPPPTVLDRIDPAVCAVLVALRPAVAALGHPELVDVKPDGDIRLGDSPWWDCPPYHREAVYPSGSDE